MCSYLYFQLHGTHVIPGQSDHLMCEARCADFEADKVCFEIYFYKIFEHLSFLGARAPLELAHVKNKNKKKLRKKF